MVDQVLSQEDQYLTFMLDNELFGVCISKVREVLDEAQITAVPCAPEDVRGVINLRGNVVPVLDLKQRFKIGRTEDSIDTCIVIVEVSIVGDSVVVGFLADSVKEVFDLPKDSIEPPPAIGSRMNVDFIKGMGKRENDFIIILDIDKIFVRNFTGQS